MKVPQNVNMGTVATVVLCLALQSLAVVWWASNVTTSLDAVAIDVVKNNRDVVIEQRRIYDRIVDVERRLGTLAAESQTTSALLQNLLLELNGATNDQ